MLVLVRCARHDCGISGYGASVGEDGRCEVAKVIGCTERCFWWRKDVLPIRKVTEYAQAMSLIMNTSSLGAALSWISSARGRVGEYPSSGQVLQVPFGCAFGLPGPENPPRMRLVGIKLSVNKMLEIVLVGGTQICHCARVFAVARADIGRARVGKTAIITGSFSKAVKPFCAVGLCTGPFADDGPLVCLRELRAETAGSRDVVRGAHGNSTRSENLILMGIE